ncbi:MAG: hypothetical protein WA206_19870, partial [Candidatus Binatus sp.]
ALADHNLEFAEILREFCERIVCGIAKRHRWIVSSVQVWMQGRRIAPNAIADSRAALSLGSRNRHAVPACGRARGPTLWKFTRG